jgi:hypothetical protein
MRSVERLAVAIGENVEPLREFVKPHLALYTVEWESRVRTSTTPWPPSTVTDLRPTGSKGSIWPATKIGPPRRCPTKLVRDVNLIGTREFVSERLAAFREAGATTLNVAPIAETGGERIKLIETLATWLTSGSRQSARAAANAAFSVLLGRITAAVFSASGA